MKARNLLITLLAIVLTAGIVQAEDKSTEELSSTRYAEVEIRITTDPKVFPMGTKENDILRLSDLMLSQDVLGSVWREVLGTSDREDSFAVPTIEMPRETGGLQTARMKIIVTLKDRDKPVAKEFIEAYINKLKDKLQKEHDFGRELYTNKLRVYNIRRDQEENRLQSLLERQSDLAGGMGTLDKESVRRKILEHERAKIDNDMQQAILQKRSDALGRQITIVHAQKEEVMRGDPVIQEMTKSLDQHTADLESSSKTLKMLSDAGKMDAEIESKIVLLNTQMHALKIHLAERKNQIQEQVAGDIKELTRQHREIVTRLEELDIEKSVLYGYSPGSLKDSMNYEMLEVKIEAAKESLRRAIIELDQTALQHDLLQLPTVSYDKIVSSEITPRDN